MESAPHSKNTSAFSIHLDAIRGIAALMVFFGHARYFLIGSPTDVLLTAGSAAATAQTTGETTTWGHQAVVVFFILSGFLVGGSVLRDMRTGKWSWSKYLLNRMTRLWVVLLPALIAGWAIDHYGLMHFAGLHTIYDAPPGQTQIIGSPAERLTPLVFLGNVFFLQTILVDFFGSNTALWSLANEFWYYIAFPLLVLAVAGRRKPWIRVLCGLLCAGVLAFVGGKIAFYFLIWLFGVGAAMAPYRIPPRIQRPAILVSLLVFIAANVYLRRALLQIEISDTLLAITFFALLYAVLHRRQPAAQNLYQAAAQGLSKVSYTLYVVHFPALVFACALLSQPWQRWPMTPLHLLWFGGVLLVVFAYACVMYLLFEAHTATVRNWVSKRLWKQQPKVLVETGVS